MFKKLAWYIRFVISALPTARQYLRRFGLWQTLRQAAMISLSWFRNPGNEIDPSMIYGESSPVFSSCEVLMVTGASSSPSHAYRVGNFVSAARELGYKSTWVTIDEVIALKALPRSVALVIFWRTNLDLEVFNWYRDLKVGERPFVVYDTDDLTFDSDIYTEANVAGLSEVSTLEKNFLTTTLVAQQHKQIVQSDLCIAATPALGEAFIKSGKDSIYLPIVIPDWMEEQAEQVYNALVKDRADFFKIVYASGTKSHGKDFLAAWPAIQVFLRKNQCAEFTVIGDFPISKNDIPKDIRDRVLSKPLVPHHALLESLVQYDVQIAPLELPNQFVEAKSATKFMQAAAVRVPTIASPSEPFRRAISHKANGWIASSTEDWLEALEDAMDPARRKLVSEAAYRDYKKNHTLNSILGPMREVISRSRNEKQHNAEVLSSTKARKRVAWIIPDIPAGSGGHRNILRFVNHLDKSKFDCQVYVLHSRLKSENITKFIQEHYGFYGISVIQDSSSISEFDIVFATHHSTVDVAKRYAGRSAKLAYLVQDFESSFYPMSPQYLHAINSYSDPDFQIICSGPWMSQKIKEITGTTVPYFDFPIDSSVYFCSEDSKQNPLRDGIIFFAKADTPRRLFDTGIDALRLVRKWHPNERITLFGGSSETMSRYKSEFQILGRLPHLSDLASLYRRSKLGLAFSTTNPSLIPYEMMACGLPIVDVELQSDKFPKYGEGAFATLAKPDSLSVAEAISGLLKDELGRNQKAEAGYLFTKNMPDEIGITSIMENFINNL